MEQIILEIIKYISKPQGQVLSTACLVLLIFSLLTSPVVSPWVQLVVVIFEGTPAYAYALGAAFLILLILSLGLFICYAAEIARPNLRTLPPWIVLVAILFASVISIWSIWNQEHQYQVLYDQHNRTVFGADGPVPQSGCDGRFEIISAHARGVEQDNELRYWIQIETYGNYQPSWRFEYSMDQSGNQWVTYPARFNPKMYREVFLSREPNFRLRLIGLDSSGAPVAGVKCEYLMTLTLPQKAKSRSAR